MCPRHVRGVATSTNRIAHSSYSTPTNTCNFSRFMCPRHAGHTVKYLQHIKGSISRHCYTMQLRLDIEREVEDGCVSYRFTRPHRRVPTGFLVACGKCKVLSSTRAGVSVVLCPLETGTGQTDVGGCGVSAEPACWDPCV